MVGRSAARDNRRSTNLADLPRQKGAPPFPPLRLLLPRMRVAEGLRRGPEGREVRVRVGLEPVNQPLQHQHTVSTSDDLGMHRQREDTLWDLAPHEGELALPDLLDF